MEEVEKKLGVAPCQIHPRVSKEAGRWKRIGG